MAQTRECRGVATTIRTDGNGVTHVRYHDTDVVSFSRSRVTLRTGGWHTVTTARRMNQASQQFNLGFHVTRKSKRDGSYEALFVDGREIGDEISFARVRLMYDGQIWRKATRAECRSKTCEYRKQYCHAKGVPGCEARLRLVAGGKKEA